MQKQGKTATPVSPVTTDVGKLKTENAPITGAPAPAAQPTAVPAQTTQAPTEAPKEATAKPTEPPANEYGGEYQATSEDMAVVNTQTGKTQFTFNRDEELSLQSGRLKVTPENRINPDNLQPVNQIAQQQQAPSSFENAAGMFNGIKPQTYSPITTTAQNNFTDRLQPASMPQNDGIMRAYAQSFFHDTFGSNYGYGTAASIRNGYNTIIS